MIVNTSVGQDGVNLTYNVDPLVLTDTTLTDALGSFKVGDLPTVQPKCSIGLKENASPIVKGKCISYI